MTLNKIHCTNVIYENRVPISNPIMHIPILIFWVHMMDSTILPMATVLWLMTVVISLSVNRMEVTRLHLLSVRSIEFIIANRLASNKQSWDVEASVVWTRNSRTSMWP